MNRKALLQSGDELRELSHLLLVDLRRLIVGSTRARAWETEELHRALTWIAITAQYVVFVLQDRVPEKAPPPMDFDTWPEPLANVASRLWRLLGRFGSATSDSVIKDSATRIEAVDALATVSFEARRLMWTVDVVRDALVFKKLPLELRPDAYDRFGRQQLLSLREGRGELDGAEGLSDADLALAECLAQQVERNAALIGALERKLRTIVDELHDPL